MSACNWPRTPMNSDSAVRLTRSIQTALLTLLVRATEARRPDSVDR